MMDSNKYKLSFTAAGLSVSESVVIASVYADCRDWDKTKTIVSEENSLQSRTKSRNKRVYHELEQRLKKLTDNQIELLENGTIIEQKQILWYAICKTYDFIREFAIEVVHEKFMSLNMELTKLDYEAFYNRKADWHPELEEITESTQVRLRQVAFKMLRDVGLISDDHVIIPTLLSPNVEAALKADAPTSYQIFPVHLGRLLGG